MITAFLAVALLMAAGPDSAPPPLRRSADGSLVINTWGGATKHRFELQMDMSRSGTMTVAQQLSRILPTEPFDIIGSDDNAGTATVSTTDWGGWILTNNNHNWSSIKVAAIVPPFQWPETRACTRTIAYLDLEPEDGKVAERAATFDRAICPKTHPLAPLEQLVLEGRSADGERLWLTHAPDPRFVRAESAAPNGQFQTDFVGSSEQPVIAANFIAPITPLLATIRWFEVTREGSLRLIGVSNWPAQEP